MNGQCYEEKWSREQEWVPGGAWVVIVNCETRMSSLRRLHWKKDLEEMTESEERGEYLGQRKQKCKDSDGGRHVA